MMGSGVMISLTLRPWERAYSCASRPGPTKNSSQRGRRRWCPGFGPTEEIAFRDDADEPAFLVDDRQAAHAPLQHDTNGLKQAPSGSTVTTGEVMMSLAFMHGSPICSCAAEDAAPHWYSRRAVTSRIATTPAGSSGCR